MKLEWLASKRFVLLVALACVAACTNATGALWDSRLLIGAARTEFPPGYGVGGNLVDLRYAGNGLPGAEGCLWSASDPFAWFFRCPGRRAESGVWKANLQERNEGIYLDQGPATSHWSWPLADSAFWPGTEIAVMSASRMATVCPDVGALPVLTKGTNGASGSRTRYTLPMSKLFRCASDRGWFTAAMPSGSTPVDFVDWFVEVSATWGMVWLAIDDPLVDAR